MKCWWNNASNIEKFVIKVGDSLENQMSVKPFNIVGK